MHPVLFKWRAITVWSYPAMLYFGLVFGVLAGNIVAHANAVDAFRVYIATFILIVPALAGARMLYVAAEWPMYRNNLRRVWDRSNGGYIMYGGLPAALLVSVPLLRILHLSIPAFWDVAIFTILVGMFFTRIGCLLNGCCAGRPSAGWFGFYLPNRDGTWKKRIPTQALEAGVGRHPYYFCCRSTPFNPVSGRAVFAGFAWLRRRPSAKWSSLVNANPRLRV